MHITCRYNLINCLYILIQQKPEKSNWLYIICSIYIHKLNSISCRPHSCFFLHLWCKTSPPASFWTQQFLKFHPCVKVKHLLQNFICCKGHCNHWNSSQVIDAHSSVQTSEHTILLVNEDNCTDHPYTETE